jgi:hypothetical protein
MVARMLNADSHENLGIAKEKMDEFLRVCQALKTIRDQRLFRKDFASFDDYCRIRWGLAVADVERNIAEAELELSARKANCRLQ